MKHIANVAGQWLLVAMLPIVLSACATIGTQGLDIKQSLYAAHGAYNIALSRFVAYADNPIASRSVVLQGKAINDKARPALLYSEAYIACTQKGKSSTDLVLVAAKIKCGDYSFDAATASGNSSILSTAASALLSLLGGK